MDERLLISTHNTFLLWNGEEERPIHSGDGSYYGVTWSEEILYVVARSSHPARLIAFDSQLNEVEPPPNLAPSVSVGDDGPHQVLWHNGRLMVVNTQYNCLGVWHPETGEIELKYYSVEARRHAGEMMDLDHLNSIWFDPVTGCYWLAEHRMQQGPKRFRKLDKNLRLLRTVEIDLDELSDGPAHCGVHNVFVRDNILITLGPSQVVLYGMYSDACVPVELEGVEPYKHYLRGLAVSVDNYYVGVSNVAVRGQRDWGRSRVLKLDQRFVVVDELELGEEHGQLMEIRLVDKHDLAHNGIACPLVEGRL
jgi:hypothetical protein